MAVSLTSLVARGGLISLILGNLLFLFFRSLPDGRSTVSDEMFSHNLESDKRGRDINYYYNGYHPNKSRFNRLASVFNSSNVTLENRKLRRPYAHDCQRPVGFPGGPPRVKRLKRICAELDAFSITCDVTKTPCQECIPPWGGESWVVDMTKKFQARELETRERRRKELKNIIETQLVLEHDESSILILTLNYGYNYLFLNWLCGLEALNIAHNIRDMTLIVATDQESEKLARELGFAVVRGDWLQFKIDKSAAKSFALGPHRWTVALQIVYAYDVVSLGYNIIQQDVDVVWLRDVRRFFDNSYLDVEMACDGRLDRIGPGNTGFVRVRSNCKTKIYLETLLYYIGLVLRGRSDQRVWNMFLMEYDFRQVLFEMLPPDKFVGGHMWGNGRRKGDQLSQDIWFLHASWTSSHSEKVTKFEMLEAWFLNQTCRYWEEGMTPQHIEPHYYVLPKFRDWKFPDPNEKKWW